MYFFIEYQSPLGMLTIASDGDNIVGLWMEGQKYFGGTLSGDMEKKDDLFVFKTVEDWLDRKAGNSGRACGKFCVRFPMEK